MENINRHNIFPNLKWMWIVSKGIRTKAVLNMILETVRVVLDFGFIIATKRAIDIATGKIDGKLIFAAIILVSFVYAGSLLNYCQTWISSILGAKSRNMMQIRTFSKLMHSVWNGSEEHHSGDTMNRMVMDSDKVTTVITDTFPRIFAICVRLIGAFIFIFTMQPILAVVMICISPFFLAVSRFYVRKMRPLSKDVRDTDSKIQTIIQENLQNRVVIKTLEQTDNVIGHLSDTQLQQVEQVRKKTKFSSVSFLIANIGFATGYLVTFIWGVFSLSAGAITYGMMTALIQLVGQVQMPFRSMTYLLPKVVEALVSSERIQELEKSPIEDDGDSVRIVSAGVKFENVTFSYREGDRDILKDFSYDFKPGTITAVLGETGAGKTTMIRLILALLKPVSGDIFFYDDKIKISASPNTRCNLVYVPQGNTLMSGTIRDNLLLGNPDASEDDLNESLKIACAEFVFELNDGLDTVCGEDGAGMSEGQAQRISIARSLLRNGSILLLDEVTSALDVATEDRLISNLKTRAVRFNQTIIFITHRTSLLNACTDTLHIKATK